MRSVGIAWQAGHGTTIVANFVLGQHKREEIAPEPAQSPAMVRPWCAQRANQPV